MDDTAQLLERLLATALLPLWLLAGFADSLCHRAQRIEETAGLKESLLHWLMLLELGAGVLAALLLQVNAGVLALTWMACAAHELTMCCDLAYASSRRRIPAHEQWVHGFQHMLPWVAWLLLAVIHRGQAAALLGLGPTMADWTLQWKSPPLPVGYVVTVVAAAAVLVVAPLGVELSRCLRTARGKAPSGSGPSR